ncbi:MAG: conjugal transfer protein TraX [Clostridiales bacterium]|nr:conjugal transfer protein TraX [Clostridiales bacterium]
MADQSLKISGCPGISGTALKRIALTAMLIDHVAVVLIGALLFGEMYNPHMEEILGRATESGWLGLYAVMRLIGRISFPIYAFLLTEGFAHTRNMKNYLMRLLVFGCISEIPFDLAFFGSPCYWRSQNVYFTLALGVVAMACVKRFEKNYIVMTASVALCCAAAQLMGADYGAYGVLLVVLLHSMRTDEHWQLPVGAVILLMEYTGILALIPIRMYNGSKGNAGGKRSYWFYAFYPAHLLLLWLVVSVAF